MPYLDGVRALRVVHRCRGILRVEAGAAVGRYTYTYTNRSDICFSQATANILESYGSGVTKVGRGDELRARLRRAAGFMEINSLEEREVHHAVE